MDGTERKAVLASFNIKELALGNLTNRCNFTTKDRISENEHGTDKYCSYFSFRDDAKEYAHSEIKDKTGNVIKKARSFTRYSGIVAADYLIIDIDYKKRLETAQIIAQDLLRDLEDKYEVDLRHFRVFFSGNKGFHIMLPAYLFEEFTPAQNLPLIHKRLVKKLCESVIEKHQKLIVQSGPPVIDDTIYKTTGLIRMNNTVNSKSGLYKIELSCDELFHLDVGEIKKMAHQQRKLQREVTEEEANKNLVYLYEDIKMRSLSDKSRNDEDTEVTASYDYNKLEKLKISGFEAMKEKCAWLKNIIKRSENGENINHSDRVALAILLMSFGSEGIKKVHEILGRTPNYDQQKTEYHLKNFGEKDYFYPSCARLCPDGKCAAMNARGKKSPIVFAYTKEMRDYQFENFQETGIAEYFIEKNPEFKYSLIEDSFYMYEGGVYSRMSDIEALGYLNSFLDNVVTPGDITERRIKALLERLRMHSKITLRGEFNTEKYLINLKNGVYDLRNRSFTSHTPSLQTSIQLKFDYDPEVEAPRFESFLNEIFNNDKDIIDFILDTMCYFLIPDYSFQKIYIFLGGGRNGKGVLASIIRELLGSANTSGLSMHEIANKGFAAIHLKDKLLNISSEIDSQELSMSMIKRLSGGDIISADRKFKEMDMFVNKARLLILANNLPRFSEISTAVLERFILVRFPRTFINDDVNTNLANDLKEELPGIFNMVASRFERIVQGEGVRYAIPKIIEENKKIFLSEVSSVAEFISQVGSTPGIQLTKSLYAKYVEYCQECNYKPRGYKNFISDLEGPLKFKTEKKTEGKVIYMKHDDSFLPSCDRHSDRHAETLIWS